MNLNELEKIANDEQEKVPSDLEHNIDTLINTLAFAENLKSKKESHKSGNQMKWLCMAATFVLVIGFAWLMLSKQSEPKDTFSDPCEAYAYFSSTMDCIASIFNEGMEEVDAAILTLKTLMPNKTE